MSTLLVGANRSLNIEYGSIPQFVEESTQLPGGCSIFETSCNLTSLIVGVGLLSLPFAAKTMGWSALGGLALLCLIFMYMFKLLADALEIRYRTRAVDDNEPVDYASLAEDALGKFGARLALFFVGTELGLALVLFLMNIGINVNIVSPDISYFFGVIVASLLAFLLTTLSMKYVAYSSMFGLGMTVLTVMAIIASGVLMDQRPSEHTKHYDAIVPSGVPLSMGMMALCFAGHSAFPKIYFSMSDRKQIVSVLGVVSSVVMATYATAMIAGYYFYAQYVVAPVTLNIGRTLTFEDIPEGGAFLRIIAAVGITANLQVTCPLVLFPIRDIALRLCHISHNSRHETIASLTILTVCLSLALLFQGYFADVCGLIGSICTTINSVLFPILFYHSIHRKDAIGTGKYWLHGLVLVIALSAALSGIVSDFCSIFKTYC